MWDHKRCSRLTRKMYLDPCATIWESTFRKEVRNRWRISFSAAMPMNHSVSSLCFRTATRSPKGSAIPTEGKRTFPNYSFANRMQNNYSFCNGWHRLPLNFLGGARKNPTASSSSLQQEAGLSQESLLSLSLLLSDYHMRGQHRCLCEFHWLSDLLAWFFFRAYRC